MSNELASHDSAQERRILGLTPAEFAIALAIGAGILACVASLVL